MLVCQSADYHQPASPRAVSRRSYLTGGKAKLLVKGMGTGLSDPTLPLGMSTTGVRAQLINRSNNLCWESEFPASKISSDEGNIKATAP